MPTGISKTKNSKNEMREALKKSWKLLRLTIADFVANKVLKLSAALAYYTVFSLPAMLIIIISVSDLFYRREAVEGSLYGQIRRFVGEQAAIQIQETIRAAALSSDSGWVTLVGILTLVIGATSVFTEIQDSINQIWKLKTRVKTGKGILKLLFNRLLSFSLVVSLGFLLLVSLIVNSALDALVHQLTRLFPGMEFVLVYGINLVLTFAITSFLFAIIFKVLPDARIKWKHIRAGAFTTAALFMIGKFFIGLYLGQSRFSDSYGAAGSVIIILVWVYYSACILYLGAVFTRVYLREQGSRIFPNDYAVWVQEIEIESDQQPERKKRIETPGKNEPDTASSGI